MTDPVELAPNPIDHFYRGGDRIAALRGFAQTSEFQPEEWLAATVTRDGEAASGIGLAHTLDGRLLRDLIAADPAVWIGPDHPRAWRAGDTGVLVKLLDARQRLPVHVHPPRDFARSHLECPYGKTEAWIVLAAEPGAAFHLGWREAVDPDELEHRREAQDAEWMLARMHHLQARRGMGVLVPAGTVHAIDAGIWVAEVQEPTDFSILLEWSITSATRDESHLGLGFERASEAISTEPLPSLEHLVVQSDLDERATGAVSLLPAGADPYFRAHRAGTGARFEGGFAVVLALRDTVLDTGHRLRSGSVHAIPAGLGAWGVRAGDAIVHRPGAGWPRSLGDAAIR